MTLFASHDALPDATVRAVWDLFLVDGWKAIFRVILVILDVLSEVCCGLGRGHNAACSQHDARVSIRRTTSCKTTWGVS